MTPRQLKVLLRPSILKDDESNVVLYLYLFPYIVIIIQILILLLLIDACKYIRARIKLDNEAREQHAADQQAARTDRLNLLSKRHLELKQLETRCGVPKHRRASSLEASVATSPQDKAQTESLMMQTRFSDFTNTSRYSSESQAITKLKRHKHVFQSPQPYANAEFRGLVHADGVEVLKHVAHLRPSHPLANEFLIRSSSSGKIRNIKQTITTSQFPKPLGAALISPLKCDRRETLGRTISSNISSWYDISKGPCVKFCRKDEIAQKKAEDNKRQEVESEAKAFYFFPFTSFLIVLQRTY